MTCVHLDCSTRVYSATALQYRYVQCTEQTVQNACKNKKENLSFNLASNNNCPNLRDWTIFAIMIQINNNIFRYNLFKILVLALINELSMYTKATYPCWTDLN